MSYRPENSRIGRRPAFTRQGLRNGSSPGGSGRFHGEQTQPPELMSRVVVKFAREVALPYRDGAETALPGVLKAYWLKVGEQCGAIRLLRMIRGLTHAQLQGLIGRAKALDPAFEDPGLDALYMIECRDVPCAIWLATRIRNWPGVIYAYVDAMPSSSAVLNPEKNTFFGAQPYLQPAPLGLDLVSAYPFDGSGGEGQIVVDLEVHKGWLLTHPDFAGQDITPLYVSKVEVPEHPHGTKSLGVLAAANNQIGTIGVCPAAKILLADCSASGKFNFADAVVVSAAALEPGGVICAPIGGFGPADLSSGPAGLDAVKVAVASGVIFVGAAGNSYSPFSNLDDPESFVFIPFAGKSYSSAHMDSGAIIVGAATPSVPHVNVWNYGRRVDAWAPEGFYTCSYLTDFAPSYQPYSGTSAATCVISGFVTVVQGLWEHRFGEKLMPSAMRQLIRKLSRGANGTPVTLPGRPQPKIGGMPSLKFVVDRLWLEAIKGPAKGAFVLP